MTERPPPVPDPAIETVAARHPVAAGATCEPIDTGAPGGD